MKKLIFAFLIFLFSASMYAQEKKVLGVFMNDGTSVCFYLSELPVVTFVDDAVKIVSAYEEALIERSDVDRFEFLADKPTSVGDVEEDVVNENFELDGSTIRVSGLVPGSEVRVFSVNGQLHMTAVAGKSGDVALGLDSLSKGVYLVNYNETTIKFIKR